MRPPSSPDPQVRYALTEANVAFVRKADRHRADPVTVALVLVSTLAVLTYIVHV
jgi:hypothetical protein